MIRRGELKHITKNIIEVGMFNPKSGSDADIFVVNFYVKEEDTLAGVLDFIEYMPIDSFISTSTSNYMDEDGYYIVFVEFEKNDASFLDLLRFVDEVTNLTEFEEWSINLYKKEPRVITMEEIRDAISNLVKD